MHLKPISFKDIPGIKDIKNEFDRMHVLVEWQTIISLNNPKVIKCYVPAYAHKDKDTIIVCYEHHPKGSYDPYFVEFAYDEDNVPALYEFTSIGIRECLLLALGVLLGYDEVEDCFRPFLDHYDENEKCVYKKWFDIPQLKDNWKIWTEF